MSATSASTQIIYITQSLFRIYKHIILLVLCSQTFGHILELHWPGLKKITGFENTGDALILSVTKIIPHLRQAYYGTSRGPVIQQNFPSRALALH